MRVELGGGLIPADGYINLDPHHGADVWRRRVQDGIPAGDGELDAVRASHLLEHIPAGQERIDLFNEVRRALRPGGTFEIIVPLLVGTWHAVADPTHVSFWVFPESLLYFCEGPFKANADYGIDLWAPLGDDDWTVADGWEGHATLRKPG